MPFQTHSSKKKKTVPVTIAENGDLILAKARADTSIEFRLIPCGAAVCYCLDKRGKAIRLVVRSNFKKTLSADMLTGDKRLLLGNASTFRFSLQAVSWVALESLYSTSIPLYFPLPALRKYSRFLRLIEWLIDSLSNFHHDPNLILSDLHVR
jgi:hypothetical protein